MFAYAVHACIHVYEYLTHVRAYVCMHAYMYFGNNPLSPPPPQVLNLVALGLPPPPILKSFLRLCKV